MNIIEELKTKRDEIDVHIRKIQDACSHPVEALTKKHGSATGNYDNNDHYWTDFHCLLCDKIWTEEGSK